MPPFEGQISEEEVIALIAFLQSLERGGTPQRVDDYPPPGKLRPARPKEAPVTTELELQQPAPATPLALPTHTYLNASRGFASWLLTKDHKRIAILYLFPVTAMFFIGAFFMVIVRLNLMTPTGELVSADTYNKSFTAHGVIMVFFFLVPVVPVVLGNFCLPLMIGAKDLAFPRLNLLSWYVYMFAAAWVGGHHRGRRRHWLDFLHALQLAIEPLQRRPHHDRRRHFWLLLDDDRNQLHRHDSLDAGARTALVSPADLRLDVVRDELHFSVGSPGAGDGTDSRHRRAGVSNRHLRPGLGRRSAVVSALFWFYSHPAVYIMILPGMGIVSEVIPCFARKELFGYKFVAYASFGIAWLGILRMGAPHVCGGHLDLRRLDLFVS